MAAAGDNNLRNVLGTAYFNLQKHQMWLQVVTDDSPKLHEAWDEACLCVMGKCTPEDDTHQVYTVHMYVHHSHTDRTYSHHWRQQSAIPLSSQIFHDTPGATCAWISFLDAVRVATTARIMHQC